ncbi:PAS domain S-box-containing protein [Bradyrhizobium barranii subsp. barranii]|nr:PAS domain S-box-containing protein [Bradyrhizobium japonicum]MCP1964761.1 PAS domain S-box-containing protein [Bradyrhizobium japonicum]
MKLRPLLTLALAAQVAVALLASHAATGTGFGFAQVVALLASGAVAVLLARLCTRAIETAQDKRAAAQLAEQAQASAQMTQAVIKTALDAFVQTDANGIVLEWSVQAEALTGWTRKEALGADVVNLLIAEPLRDGFRQRMMRLLPELSDTPIGIRFEATLLHRNGDQILIEASSTALQLGGRTIINNFVKDVTQKRAAEEQLIQAQKMEAVGQLTGGIAHEFNNMLTVITGTIEILADAVKDAPPLATITKLISEAADRGAALTSSLLSFARKQALQPAEIDVNELLEEVAKLLLATFDKTIEIVSRLDRNVWLAFADRGQLSAALLNLAINARDAMLDGGKLSNASSIRSSRPRMSARAPGSVSAWCSASSNSPAAASRSRPKKAAARCSRSTCRRPRPARSVRLAMTSARSWVARRQSFASRTIATSANMSPSSSKASATRSSPPPTRPKRSPSWPKARRSICSSPTS